MSGSEFGPGVSRSPNHGTLTCLHAVGAGVAIEARAVLAMANVGDFPIPELEVQLALRSLTLLPARGVWLVYRTHQY